MLLRFHDVAFGYDRSATLLWQNLTVDFTKGWTGIIGANGAGKTTLLRLACGELQPVDGRVQLQGDIVYCRQRTDDPPPQFACFLAATDGDAFRYRGLLAIGDDWLARWRTLSHGERKRAQIAEALWRAPQVLAVDEPTNHIDKNARDLLAQALKEFDGIGLLVSHDRELLDTLCRSCLFLIPPRVTLRPGGYSQAVELERMDRRTDREQHEAMQSVVNKLEREATKRRQTAAQSAKRLSKRGISAKDHDAKEKRNRAKLTGKDGQAGRLARQLRGRVDTLQSELAVLPIEKEYETGIWLSGSFSRRDHLFSHPEGEIPFGDDRKIVHPALYMLPDDRIGITGPNGAGKSTLVRYLIAQLQLSADELVYLPQEIDSAGSRRIMDEVRALSHAELGRTMNIVNRLGTRPARLLETEEPSPGELRKILLALGIMRQPHLLILDEPTNHLDLPAIECLEVALTDCPCGLMLVSHDMALLRKLARIRWHIEAGKLEIRNDWS